MSVSIPEDLPFISRLGDHPGIYVFPDKRAPSFRPGHAIAGPFQDARGARLWILEYMESRLVDSRRVVWGEVCKKLGTMSQDLGIEFFLLDGVLHGRTAAQLDRYIPKPERRQIVDRRMAAAGERTL